MPPQVCIAPGYPSRAHRCGELQKGRGIEGTAYHNAETQHGNSGAGAYDEAGNLIGVVTVLTTCNNGQICGGGISPLWEILWIVPHRAEV